MLSPHARVKSRRSHEAHVRVLHHHHCHHNTQKTPKINEMVVASVHTIDTRGRVAVPRCPQQLGYSSAPSSGQLEAALKRRRVSARAVAPRSVAEHRSTIWKKRVQKQGTCSLGKVRSATPCICVDARSCNCNDNLQLRSLPIHVSDWKNFNAQSSHKRLQHSSGISGETISTMVLCFAVPSCPFRLDWNMSSRNATNRGLDLVQLKVHQLLLVRQSETRRASHRMVDSTLRSAVVLQETRLCPDAPEGHNTIASPAQLTESHS